MPIIVILPAPPAKPSPARPPPAPGRPSPRAEPSRPRNGPLLPNQTFFPTGIDVSSPDNDVLLRDNDSLLRGNDSFLPRGDSLWVHNDPLSRRSGDRYAFLYTGTPGADGRMIDLDAWLNAHNAAEGGKWILEAALGVNDTGWVTGYGIFDSDGPGPMAAPQTRAFLLDAGALVPEPGAVGVLVIGGLLSLLPRRRR